MVTDTTIKKRYKQTEIGVIPEEWRILALKELSTEILQGVNTAIDIPEYVEDGIPMLKANNVIDQEVEFKGCDHISLRTFQKYSERFKIKKDDFLFSNIGARLGTGSLFQHEIECSFAWNVMKIRPNKRKIKPQYLNYILNSNYVSQVIKQIQTGSGMGFVSKDAMANILFAIAPLPEQTAIATVLSDTDALIECLEKLIAKKKAIKQGTMQQLLTGKKRLPGFNGEWEVKKLGEVCWYQEGPGVRNYQFTISGVKLLNGTNISNGKVVLDTTNRYISEKEAFGWYRHFLVDDGDILIASSGVTIDRFHEKVAFASSNHLPLCMNTSTIRFKANSELLDKYLYFFLQSDLFKNQIGKQATGSAQLNFGPSHLNKINIDFPPTKEEQITIATVLSDMDAEIESLEQKRDKYTMLKQGMMQQLLTGRIRIYANN